MLWPPPAKPMTVTVIRPNYDSRGNRYDSRGNPLPEAGGVTPEGSWTLTAVVSVQPAMDIPRLAEGTENRFIQDASIFIKRTATGPNGVAALQAGDAVIYNGEDFVIAGDSRGDQAQPFTGFNFGWKGYRMQAVG